ncbi:MAG: hypothetical protein WC319_05420 [Candidatus Paceibacterota bacterium]|jgi:hypothetical protein
MLGNYATQNLILSKWASRNEYNEPMRTLSSIKGRKEEKLQLVVNSNGEQVLSSAFVMTEIEVNINDLIDGRMVIASSVITGLSGSTLWYEVYLK